MFLWPNAAKGRRFRRRWNKWLFFVFLFLCTLFLSFQIQHPMYFRKFRNVKMSRECTSPKVLQDVVELTHEVHLILSELNITHFLLYGSHWGAIRVGGPLPWDDDGDLGMIANENFLSLTEEEFVDLFASQGMNVTNNMAQKTSLKLDRGNAHVDVMVYYDNNGLMKRKGWEPFLIPVHYRLHHSFPTWVVRTPPSLPTIQFGNFNMSIPRGGREIMKYLYRYNWWKNYEPVSICKPIQW